MPGGAKVGGGQLKLRPGRCIAADLDAGQRQDLSLPQVNRRLFGRPLLFGEVRLNGRLCPALPVVGAGERSPRVGGAVVAVGTGEPKRHETVPGEGETVGDLDRRGIQFRCRQAGERDAVFTAVEVVAVGTVRGRVDPANPQEHRAGGIEPLADSDLAAARGGGDDGLVGPASAEVARAFGEDLAGVLIDVVGPSPAVGAD